MARNDMVQIPDMSKEISEKIVAAVNLGIQKAEKELKNSTVKINGMNVQVDMATQNIITSLNKQIEEINKKKSKLNNTIKEIYSYQPNGNKQYAISQSGNSYALTDQQIQAIEQVVNASKEAGSKITASEKKQLELQYRLINAKEELINKVKTFQSLDENAFDSKDVKQYYQDVLMLEKVMKNIQSLSKETGLQNGFNTKGIDVKSLVAQVKNKDWISGKLTQGLDNEVISLQNKIQTTVQNAQQNLVSSIMKSNPLSKIQEQLSNAESAIDSASSKIEQRVNQLVNEINSSWSIINDDNATQSAYDNAEKQLEKSVTTLSKYKDLFKDNVDVNNILNNEELQLYIDEDKIKKIKDDVIEANTAIISSNQEVITSSQEYIKSLDWADGTLGIAHGDEILQTLKDTIKSLTEENEALKISLKNTGEIASEEFNKLQQKFEASEKIIKELQDVVSQLESKIKKQNEELNTFKDSKNKVSENLESESSAQESSKESSTSSEKISVELEQIQEATNKIVNNLSNSLIETVTKFKEELQSTSKLSYTKMFESLRNSLRDIVNEFQTSLTNIKFNASNDLYNTLKGWNDASRYMSNYNSKSDSERAAFANLNTGSISNSYVFDKNNSFSNQLLEILKKASQGVEEDIGKVYDTWIHSHPIENSKRIETSKNKWENVATVGSDVGFSVADLNTWVKQGLESGLKNMLVTNNYKYTKLDLTDVGKEKFEEFKKEFIKNLESVDIKVNKTTGDTVVPVSLKGTEGQKYIDLDDKTKKINSAMIKASETVFGSNRVTTGNITDLISDVNILSKEEQKATSNAQELFDVVIKLNDALNNSDKVLQFGISEESLNGIIDKLNEIIEAIKNINTKKIEDVSASIQKIRYHYGNLNTGNKSHTFGDEIHSYVSGLRNGGRGWADGTGTYTTSDINQYNNGDFSDSLKQFYAIDISKLKMYEAHIEKEAEAFYNFQHKLEQYCIALGSGFSGFDDNLNQITSEDLYKEAQEIFNKYPEIFKEVFKDFEEFNSFINEMINLVSISGIREDGGIDSKKMYGFKNQFGKDDIKTRFMKKLGFDGTDLSGTSYDTLKSGSVIYDIDSAEIVSKFKTISEAINYSKTIAEQTSQSVQNLNKDYSNIDNNKINVSPEINPVDFAQEVTNQLKGHSATIDVKVNNVYGENVYDEKEKIKKSYTDTVYDYFNSISKSLNNDDKLLNLQVIEDEAEKFGHDFVLELREIYDTVEASLTDIPAILDQEDQKKAKILNQPIDSKQLKKRLETLVNVASEVEQAENTIRTIHFGDSSLNGEIFQSGLNVKNGDLFNTVTALQDYADALHGVGDNAERTISILSSYGNFDSAFIIDIPVDEMKSFNSELEHSITLSSEYVKGVINTKDGTYKSNSYQNNLGQNATQVSNQLQDITAKINVEPQIDNSEIFANQVSEQLIVPAKIDVDPELVSPSGFANKVTEQLQSVSAKINIDLNETNISSGNFIVEDQNKIQEELKETANVARETSDSLEKIVTAYRGVSIKGTNGISNSFATFLSSSPNLAALYQRDESGFNSSNGELLEVKILKDKLLSINANGSMWDSIEYWGEVGDKCGEEAKQAYQALIDTLKKYEENIRRISDDNYLSQYYELGIFDGKRPQTNSLINYADILGSQYTEEDFGNNKDFSDLISMSNEIRIAKDRLEESLSKNILFGIKTTNDYVFDAMEQGYKGVEFKDVIDKGFNSGKLDLSTVYAIIDSSLIQYVEKYEGEIERYTQLRLNHLGIEEFKNTPSVDELISKKFKNDNGELYPAASNYFYKKYQETGENPGDIYKKTLWDEEKTKQAAQEIYEYAIKTNEEYQQALSTISSNPIKDVFQGNVNLSGIDKLEEKIKALFTDTYELQQILKSLHDGSYFDLSWVVDGVDKDGYLKINTLKNILNEYGYTIKNLKEDSEAWSTSGQIVSLKNEYTNSAKKALTAKEKAKKTKDATSFINEEYFNDLNKEKEDVMSLKAAYETLISTKKNYLFLSKKSTSGTATDEEISKLEELTVERQKALDTINNYANSDGNASKFTSAIDQALSKMKELQYAGTGDTFSNVFTKASQKVEELSVKLASGEISLEQYEKQVKRIQQYVNNNKTIEFIDADNLEKAQNLMREIIAAESGGEAEISLSKDGRQLTGTWVDQNNMVQKLVMSYDELSGAMTKTSSASKKTETQTKTLSQLFKQGWQNVRQYVISFVGFYQIINAVRNGITVIKELDTALTEMRKVSDETVSSLKEFQKTSFDIAKDVGATAKEIQNSTADWMRLGEALDEASESARVANILLNVSEFDSISDATESLVAMSAAYDDLDKIEIVDKLNEVGNNFSISTDGLATALQKSASALLTAGNNIDEAAALITAGNAVVQDTDSVGTGMQTIALRLTGKCNVPEHIVICGYLYKILESSYKGQNQIWS